MCPRRRPFLQLSQNLQSFRRVLPPGSVQLARGLVSLTRGSRGLVDAAWPVWIFGAINLPTEPPLVLPSPFCIPMIFLFGVEREAGRNKEEKREKSSSRSETARGHGARAGTAQGSRHRHTSTTSASGSGTVVSLQISTDCAQHGCACDVSQRSLLPPSPKGATDVQRIFTLKFRAIAASTRKGRRKSSDSIMLVACALCTPVDTSEICFFKTGFKIRKLAPTLAYHAARPALYSPP